MIKTCETCGQTFSTRKKERRYCSKACYGLANRAENHYRWGGDTLTGTCCVCGQTFRCGSARVARRRKYCSPACSGKANRGSDSHSWKDGCLDCNGYHGVRINDVLYYVHRGVMEIHLGRPLEEGEVVHHINGNKRDNRISNLMLFPDNAAHMRWHAEQRRGQKSAS